MNHGRTLRCSLSLTLAGIVLLSSGCASLQATQADDPRDPWEGMNRAIYSFNENLDKAVLKPVATGYKKTVPQPLRTGVTNFFSNLAYPTVILNDFLQGKVAQGVDDLMRLLINSSFGLFGLLDVATPAGLPAHSEDFGQTLAVWGAGDGPYLVLPFFGPSTVRDTAGLAVDFQTDLLTHHPEVRERNALWGVKAVDKRANLLSAGRILDQAAVDPYSFTREAYLQKRDSQISDGHHGPNQDFRNDPVDPEAADTMAPPSADTVTPASPVPEEK